LFFPLGIGLLRRSLTCRTLLLTLNWILVLVQVVLILSLAVCASLGSAETTSLGSVETTWYIDIDEVGGDGVARMIGVVAICLPLFIWQFRALASRELKALLGRAGTENPAESGQVETP
jgi:hypothetical protein